MFLQEGLLQASLKGSFVRARPMEQKPCSSDSTADGQVAAVVVGVFSSGSAAACATELLISAAICPHNAMVS